MPTVTSADGTTIAYETLGTGPALILVDGALCYRDFGPARGLAAALADTYTVYIYDRRGRGASGDTQPWSAPREIDDIEAILQAAGGTAYLFGASCPASPSSPCTSRRSSSTRPTNRGPPSSSPTPRP